MKLGQPAAGRKFTRVAVAELLGLSLRTVDQHGLARGDFLTRKQAAERIGVSLRTFIRRRKERGFPPPSFSVTNRPFWSAAILDRWRDSQNPQRELFE